MLLDIDHSPKNLLHERHADFNAEGGLRRLASQIYPGGVFALWSDDAPDPEFLAVLGKVFTGCEAQVVRFHNPLLEKDSASTVYLARR